MKVRCGLTFRNISGAIDADEKERDAAFRLPLQGTQAMADRLKADAELLTEQVNVVVERLGRTEKLPVRHEEGAGEVIGEAYAGEASGFRIRKARAVDQSYQIFLEPQHCDLRRQLERLLARLQLAGEMQGLGLGIEPAMGTR